MARRPGGGAGRRAAEAALRATVDRARALGPAAVLAVVAALHFRDAFRPTPTTFYFRDFTTFVYPMRRLLAGAHCAGIEHRRLRG